MGRKNSLIRLFYETNIPSICIAIVLKIEWQLIDYEAMHKIAISTIVIDFCVLCWLSSRSIHTFSMSRTMLPGSGKRKRTMGNAVNPGNRRHCRVPALRAVFSTIISFPKRTHHSDSCLQYAAVHCAKKPFETGGRTLDEQLDRVTGKSSRHQWTCHMFALTTERNPTSRLLPRCSRSRFTLPCRTVANDKDEETPAHRPSAASVPVPMRGNFNMCKILRSLFSQHKGAHKKQEKKEKRFHHHPPPVTPAPTNEDIPFALACVCIFLLSIPFSVVVPNILLIMLIKSFDLWLLWQRSALSGSGSSGLVFGQFRSLRRTPASNCKFSSHLFVPWLCACMCVCVHWFLVWT